MVTTYLRRAYSSFAMNILDIPARLLAFLLFLLLLFFPLMDPTIAHLRILTIAFIGGIYAASWDLLIGRCGQLSLGHALFFGVGAYSTAFLSLYVGLPIWATIPLSVFVAIIFALFVGFPALRVKGPYFALITMALPLIGMGGVLFFKEITYGERGFYGLPSFFPFLSYDEQFTAQYYLVLLFLAISGIILYKIANSRTTGVVFVSILDDELASKACGINTTKYKLLAFSVSAIFASLAGAISAHILSAANMGSLTMTLSFTAVIVTIMGGIGTIYGPIAAALILEVLDKYALEKIFEWLATNNLISTSVLENETHWTMIIFIVFIVILILKWPRGIGRYVAEKLGDLAEEREIEERGKHIWKTYKKEKK